jgi:hypothetical protein
VTYLESEIVPNYLDVAGRWRCKWYAGLALFSTLAIACLDGISSADVVA